MERAAADGDHVLRKSVKGGTKRGSRRTWVSQPFHKAPSPPTSPDLAAVAFCLLCFRLPFRPPAPFSLSLRHSADDRLPSDESPIGMFGCGRPAVTKPRRCSSSLMRRKAAKPSGISPDRHHRPDIRVLGEDTAKARVRPQRVLNRLAELSETGMTIAVPSRAGQAGTAVPRASSGVQIAADDRVAEAESLDRPDRVRVLRPLFSCPSPGARRPIERGP